MNSFLKNSLTLTSAIASSFLFASCDGDKDESQNPLVLSSFELLVNNNKTGVGQPVGASLLVIERNDGLLIRGQLHNFTVIEESSTRVRFQYSGGPLASGVTGIFNADLNAKTWTLVETPGGVNRDMSGSLRVLDLGSGHSH